MLSSMTVFRRAVGLAKPSTRLLVARASSERSTSAGVTPSPDPNFETFEPAGSHPIKPTTEYVNILDNDIIKGSEYNPLQEIVPKKANVSQEALDSVFPPKPELSVKKPDSKAPKS